MVFAFAVIALTALVAASPLQEGKVQQPLGHTEGSRKDLLYECVQSVSHGVNALAY